MWIIEDDSVQRIVIDLENCLPKEFQILRQNATLREISKRNMSFQWTNLSAKSQIEYENAWKKFINFLSNGAGTEREPKTEDYLTYFDFLKVVKNLKGVTIWSIYAKLNAVHFEKYGTKLSEDSVLISTLKVRI